MPKILPPLCLLLAIAMLVTAFALGAVEAPEPGVELHKARVIGDDQYADALESQLVRRQFARHAIIAGLFVGSGLMIFAAFCVMRPAPHSS